MRPATPFFFAAALLLAFACAAAQAQPAATPIGLWKTIDDETKTEKSLVRITSDPGGALVGKVEKLLEADKQGAVCEKCTDERQGKPVAGMTVLGGVKKADPGGGAEPVWEGGQILDPNNGKTYKVRLKPIDGGARLEVRGYIGPFYRNQVWQRVE